jgi:hypothetical protein
VRAVVFALAALLAFFFWVIVGWFVWINLSVQL